jgi:hypothetical protein
MARHPFSWGNSISLALPFLTEPVGLIKFLRMTTTTQVQKNLRNAMKEALRIQDRFLPEPHFAKTGRGHMKSEGVATLQRIKSNLRRIS